MCSLRRPIQKSVFFCASVVLGLAASALAAVQYSVADLGSGTATGINDAGQIIGVQTGNREAFLYSNGVMTGLGTLPSPYTFNSFPAALNNLGEVVGSGESTPDVDSSALPPTRAFLYNGGPLVDLGTLGGSLVEAYGINDTGEIVGSSTLTGDTMVHAFADINGTMTDLGTLGGPASYAKAINNAGEIVGSSAIASNRFQVPFLYSNGIMTALNGLAGADGTATAINNNGQIAGETGILGDAFFYSVGQVTLLGDLDNGLGQSQAFALNDSGIIVGVATVAGKGNLAFVYDNGVMQELDSLVDPSQDWHFIEATGVNDAGEIVGYGYQGTDGSDVQVVLLSPVVPEPHSTALAAAAIAIAIFWPRRHLKA